MKTFQESSANNGVENDWVQSRQPDSVLSKRAQLAYLLKSYYDLSVAAKAEFTRQLNKLNSSDYAERRQEMESIMEILKRWEEVQTETYSCPICGYEEHN